MARSIHQDRLGNDMLTDFKVCNAFSDFNHFSREFVTYGKNLSTSTPQGSVWPHSQHRLTKNAWRHLARQRMGRSRDGEWSNKIFMQISFVNQCADNAPNEAPT